MIVIPKQIHSYHCLICSVSPSSAELSVSCLQDAVLEEALVSRAMEEAQHSFDGMCMIELLIRCRILTFVFQ